MFFNQHDLRTTLKLVEGAGFAVVRHAVESQREGEREVPYAWILAVREGAEVASTRTEPGRELGSWAVDRIRLGDGSRLRAARLEFLREEPWRASPLREAERSPLREWQEQAARGATADDAATFVAHEGGEWLGVVDGVATDRVTVDVANLWVRPSERRRGIGRTLMAAVEAWARRRGARRLALWVVETNDAAVDFYRRAGFEGSETRPVQSIPGLRQARMVRLLGGPESRRPRPWATQPGRGNG